MAVLTAARVAAAAALGALACYDPVLRDCTVSCTGSAACADGQTCTHGWCVEDPATTCAAREQPDAGARDDPDAPLATLATLQVVVMGGGRVELDGAMTCMDSCTFDVAFAVPHQLAATPVGNHLFQMWSGACSGSVATCELTIPMPPMPPGAMTAVMARFGN
jgi:hypothetical protein